MSSSQLFDGDASGLSSLAGPRRKPGGRAPSDNRQHGWVQWLERWRELLVYLGLALTPVVAYVGNLGFAPLVASLGIGALVFLGRRSPANTGVAILAVMVLWALVSMSWSPAMPAHPDFHRYKNIEAMTGVKLVFELTLYTAFALAMQRLAPEAASRASLILAVGLTLLSLLLLAESIDGARLYQWIKAAAHQKTRPDLATRNVARGCYLAAVLFWPAVLRLRRAGQPLLVGLFVLGFGVSAFVFRVDSPMLALALSTLVFVLVQRFGPKMLTVLMAATIFYLAAAPVVANLAVHAVDFHALPASFGKASWGDRIDIWKFVSAEVIQNPITGWGLDASRAWPHDVPLHPHDAALQIWLELGVLGIALASLFWAWLFQQIKLVVRADRNMGAAAAACATAYLTIGALSFGVWQEWWLAIGAVAIVTCRCVALSRRLDPDYGKDVAILRPIS